MELRQLDCFLAVVEHGTFTAAAVALHTVQSGVSGTIKALERELGAPLFSRSAGVGRVTLTEHGAALLPRAREVVAAGRAAWEAVQQVDDQVRGQLNVGIMTSLEPIDLPTLLAAYRARFPNITLRLHVKSHGSAELADEVESGALDVAFLSVLDGARPALRIRPLVASHLVLLLPSEHRLADVDELTLAQLAGETWIDSPHGCSNRAIVDAAFLAGGHSREVVLEVLDIAAMPRYVEAGLGVAFVPDFSGARDAPVRRRLLANQRLQWPIFLASARTAHPRPSLAAFLELATSAARDAAHRLGVSPSAADLA